MFLKLWKHELRVSGRLLGLLSAAALSLGVLAAVLLRLLIYLTDTVTSHSAAVQLLATGVSLGLVFTVLALVAYGTGVQIYLLWRFYKHKFTDEGYLTFTLPVRTHQIFFSSLANMLLWTLISGVVIAAAALIALLFGTASRGLINTDILRNLRYFSEEMSEMYRELGNPVIMWLCMLAAVPFSAVIPMTCITIGSVLVKKHKLLAAFGIYYGVNAVTGILQAVFSVFVMLVSLQQEPYLAYNLTMGGTCVFFLLLTAAGSWLSIWLMKRKLNLA